MKRILVALASFVSSLVVGGAVMGSAVLAAPNTVYVRSANCSPTGAQNKPYCTIQQGVNAVATGGTVYVAAGTYNETVTVPKSLTLSGAQAGRSAQTDRTDTSKESIVNSNPSTNGMSLEADNITVNGFTFANNTGGPGMTTAANHSGYTIINNVFANNVFGLYLNSNGSILSTVSRSRFDNNNQAGAASGNGIYGDQGTNKVTIDHNVFKNESNTAMIFVTTADAVTNNNIDANHNTFNGPGVFFILANGHGGTFNHNDGSGFTYHAVYLAGSDSNLAVDHNNFDGNSKAGWSGLRITIDSSFASGTFTPVANDNISVDHNMANNFGDAGVSVGNGNGDSTLTNSTLNHNTLNNNGTGEVDYDGGILIRTGNIGLMIDHNTMKNNNPFDAADYSTGTGNTWIHNSCVTSTPAGLCSQ